MDKIVDQGKLKNILPTKMVKRNIVILKPSFDQKILDEIANRLKAKLFTRLKFFKLNSSKIKLLSTEKYYRQYLIIKGKYAIDHCRKFERNLEVDNNAKKINIFDKEFIIDKTDKLNCSNSELLKISGVAHYTYQETGEFIFDDKNREIKSDNWIILLNKLLPKENVAKLNLKNEKFKIKFSTEKEIGFLRKKLVKRPLDVGEIIKQVFEINERKIIFCPMYKLHYQNTTNKNEAMARINGITGNVVITTFSNKTISGKFLEDLIKNPVPKNQAIEKQSKEEPKNKVKKIKKRKEKPTKKSDFEPIASKNYVQPKKQKKKLQSKIEKSEIEIKKNEEIKQPKINIKEIEQEPSAKIENEIFHVGNNVTAIIGDLEIPSETTVEDTLVVKGNFIIGQKCKILGSIKALGTIKIGDYTEISGDVISNSTILVGSKVRIFGKILSKDTIYYNEVSRG